MCKKTGLFLIVCMTVVSVWGTPVFAGETSEASDDKALIIFYRVKKFAGKGIPVGVHHAGGAIGTLKSGSSFQKYFEPGEHTFWSKVIVEDSVTLSVVAGKTYYIRGDVGMGLVVGRPKLTQTQNRETK